ncbi:recombinase family protein [Suttonella indologenes]|uniref:DNA-invertase hin n=1 Tax=Suttonella indologenes TaxID=13276 RepID=A0A380MHP6_9GAMM|nr:recombinase family protein [Suttonella indologenes]SUO90266.1 DNA-invertase hin [Suttonella indologenes]
MLIGYARVSTNEQNLHLQIDALEHAGCSKIFTDTLSGANFSRDGLEQALDYAREGDTLIIWRLDRLGRSLKDLIELVQSIEARGIALRSLHEQLDTSSATGKLIYHVFGALAEFERNLISERTLAGLRAARARGRQGGRPTKLNIQQIREIRILHKDPEISVNTLAKRYGVSRGTIYRVLETK